MTKVLLEWTLYSIELCRVTLVYLECSHYFKNLFEKQKNMVISLAVEEKRERKSRGRGRLRSTKSKKKSKSCVVQNTPEACCARYSRWEQSSGRLSLLLRLWRGVSKSCSHTLSSPLARASAGQVFSPRGLSLISLALSFHCPISYCPYSTRFDSRNDSEVYV